MKLTVIGSSSTGNSYILESRNEVLILEAGMPFADIKKALNFKINNIVGVLVTHEHMDHAKYIEQYANAGIKVYSSLKTFNKLGLNSPYLIGVEKLKQFNVGEFSILPFDCQHDCVDPLGFLINQEESGNILFATDTYYLKYKFKELNNILIECNYSIDTLPKDLHPVQRNRLLQSHMSLYNLKKMLLANDLSNVANIVLLHLSDGNSDELRFRKEIENLTLIDTKVANKGLEMELNKTLF